MLDAAGGDEHVQKLRWRGPQGLLEEFQSCRDYVVVPVLGVMQGQLIHLQTQKLESAVWRDLGPEGRPCRVSKEPGPGLKNIKGKIGRPGPGAAVQEPAARRPPSA